MQYIGRTSSGFSTLDDAILVLVSRKGLDKDCLVSRNLILQTVNVQVTTSLFKTLSLTMFYTCDSPLP